MVSFAFLVSRIVFFLRKEVPVRMHTGETHISSCFDVARKRTIHSTAPTDILFVANGVCTSS